MSRWTRTSPAAIACGVLDVDQDPVLAVDDEVGRLSGPCGDERHARRHGLEDALRPAFLARRDDVRVERVVGGRELVARREQPVDVRDRASLELSAHVAARGAGEEHDEVVELASGRVERLHEHVRALDRLRLETVLEADAVLLERADDERVLRKPERRSRRPASLVVAEWEAVELDPDRDPVDARRRDAGRDDDLLHLAMRHLHAVEPGRIALECRERPVELGVARRAGAAVEVREPEPMR